MGLMKKISLLLIGVVLLAAQAVSAQKVIAQAGLDCPASLLLAFSRANAVCASAEYKEVCLGNGTVNATFYPSTEEFAFSTPGDRAPINALHTINLTAATDDNGNWPVVYMNIPGDLPASQQRHVTVLAFGNVTLRNEIPPSPTASIATTGIAKIRTTPALGGAIISEVGIRTSLIATGQTSDGNWLRVQVPNTNEQGWVSTTVIGEDITTIELPIVTGNDPYLPPFQITTVHTGSDDALCPEAPESGVIIQTPNITDPVTLTINGVTLKLAATAFIQAPTSGSMAISILDGEAEITALGTTQYLPTGSRTSIALTAEAAPLAAPQPAEPYAISEILVLPVNSLAHRFSIQQPPSPEEIEALVNAHIAPTPPPQVTGTPEASEACRYRTRRDTTLWAGPGTFYEAVNEISGNTRVFPTLQTTNADGILWWQLNNSNWLLASAVTTTGTCDPIPIADVVPAPRTNNLSLETCMTTNGPLRDGQSVTIDFVPPGWETYADARAATQVDPGQITVNSQSLRVQASQPLRIAENKYVRTFSAHWTATPGQHRIVGERLSYIVICNLTVPLAP